MGNALKTSLVGFQPHGAEKSPLGALTLGSEPPQGGIFKGENGVHWRPKKKFVTKTMDEKHNENMFLHKKLHKVQKSRSHKSFLLYACLIYE